MKFEEGLLAILTQKAGKIHYIRDYFEHPPELRGVNGTTYCRRCGTSYELSEVPT